MPNLEMLVLKKEVQEDRILLFGSDPNFHVVAYLDEEPNIGDVIEYKYYGPHIGRYVKFVRRAKSIKNKEA